MRCGFVLLLLAAPASLAWSAQSLPPSPVLRRSNASGGSHPLALSKDALGRKRITCCRGGTAGIRRARDVTSASVALGIAASGGGDTSVPDGADAAASKLPGGILAVLAAAFLNLLGFTMAGPITPALGTHFGLNVGAKFGSLTSAYPLGMLFGLFLWPQLSDRVGRKPVMVASLLGSGLGLAVQSFAVRSNWTLPVFLAMRVMTGCFAGSSPVSKAYLADIGTAQGMLPRYLALRDAASTLAFIMGPFLGGLAFEARRRAIVGPGAEAAAAAVVDAGSSLAFVIGVSAVASLAASGLIGLFVTEDVNADASSSKAPPGTGTTNNSLSTNDGSLVACPLGSRLWTGVATVCVVSFLFNVGDSTFFAFFPALLQKNLGFDAKKIGLAFTSFACISFGVSTTVTGRTIRRFGPVATCVAGLSAVGSGLLALSGASRMASVIPAIVFGAAALYYCGVPLYGPTVPTMLLRCVPPSRRGAVMGLDGAINTMARVISPLVMGDLYRRRGPGAAFGVAGAAAFSAACIALARRLSVMRGERELFSTPEQQ